MCPNYAIDQINWSTLGMGPLNDHLCEVSRRFAVQDMLFDTSFHHD